MAPTKKGRPPANTPISPACYHCNQSLTRPDINIRSPSIPDTLGCNGLVPSQVAAVEETVAATLADIRELDREISRFEAATEELRSKRATLQSFANNHKSLLTPVTRLPVDVLSQIFQQGVIAPWLGRESNSRKENYDPDKAAVVYECDKTPLMIASVSRQWRNVALSTPRLWSVISLVLRPKHTKQYIELARMWLLRAGNSPLSIRLVTPRHYRDQRPMRKLMEIFAPTSRRWRHIHFKLPLTVLQSLIGDQFDIPMVEMLQLQRWGEDFLEVPMGAHAPRLRGFHAGPNVTTRSLKLPWNQLRDVKFISDNGDLQSAIDLLALTLDVERCELKVGGDEEPLEMDHDSLQLRHLQSLIAVFEDTDPTAFFAILCVPNIRELALSIETSWAPLKPALMNLCSQSSLEKLSLRTETIFGGALPLSAKYMIDILKAAQHLQTLEVLDPGAEFFSAQFLESFGELNPSGTPILCPKLQTILFLHPPKEKIDSRLALFTQALRARCPSGVAPTLKTVTILCDRYAIDYVFPSYQSCAWWDQLRDAGVNLQVGDAEAYEEWY